MGKGRYKWVEKHKNYQRGDLKHEKVKDVLSEAERETLCNGGVLSGISWDSNFGVVCLLCNPGKTNILSKRKDRVNEHFGIG